MDISWLTGLSPQLATFFLAMLPITELRAALPLALGVFNLPLPAAMFWSIIGNIIPAILLLYYLGPISDFFRKKNKFVDTFFTWLFARSRRKLNNSYLLWGNLALMIFVAIPLPATGAWTGAIAAWLFGIEKKQAILFISLGVIIASILVSLIYFGILKLI